MLDLNPNGASSDARVTESHRGQNLPQFPNHVPLGSGEFSRAPGQMSPLAVSLQGVSSSGTANSLALHRGTGRTSPCRTNVTLQDRRHRSTVSTHRNGGRRREPAVPET